MDYPPIPPDLPQPAKALIARQTIGPLLVGAFINCWLYGIVLLQLRAYFRTSSKDPLWRKSVVAMIAGIVSLNTAAVCWNAYDFTITKFGDAQAALYQATPAFVSTFITSTAAILMIQGYFAWRVKTVTSNVFFGGVIFALSLATVGAQLYVLIRGHALGDVRKWTPHLKPAVLVWLIGAAVTDVLIATTLVLYFQRSRTGFARTDDILSKLTRLTVQTGALTALWAVADVILYLAIPDGTHFILNLPLNKLYAISLLSSTNTRALRADREQDDSLNPPNLFSGSGGIRSPGKVHWGSRGSHELTAKNSSANASGVYVSTVTHTEDPLMDLSKPNSMWHADKDRSSFSSFPSPQSLGKFDTRLAPKEADRASLETLEGGAEFAGSGHPFASPR